MYYLMLKLNKCYVMLLEKNALLQILNHILLKTTHSAGVAVALLYIDEHLRT